MAFNVHFSNNIVLVTISVFFKKMEAFSCLFHFTKGIPCPMKRVFSESKKELENFIQAKFEDCSLGRTSQKALENFSLVRNQGTVV